MCEVLIKICNNCSVEKPVDEFSKDERNTKDGHGGLCKDCVSKTAKARREKNKARGTIIVPDFKTCPGCNCGLGHFDDSVKLLTNAIGYLLNYEESKVTDAYVAVRDATSTKQLLPTGGFTQARRQPPPKQQPPSIPIVLLIISGE